MEKTTQVVIPEASTTEAATTTPHLPKLPPAQTDNIKSKVKENGSTPYIIKPPAIATSPSVQTPLEQTPDITQPPQPLPVLEDNKCEEDSSN